MAPCSTRATQVRRGAQPTTEVLRTLCSSRALAQRTASAMTCRFPLTGTGQCQAHDRFGLRQGVMRTRSRMVASSLGFTRELPFRFAGCHTALWRRAAASRTVVPTPPNISVDLVTFPINRFLLLEQVVVIVAISDQRMATKFPGGVFLVTDWCSMARQSCPMAVH